MSRNAGLTRVGGYRKGPSRKGMEDSVMMTRFILEASRPDGTEYRFECTFEGTVLSWLSGLFGI